MYLTRPQAEELIFNLGKNIRSEIDSNIDFLFDLLEENDWSFVIKGHAMVEAAVTELLLQHLGEERLRKVIERLPLSDTQVGKIVVAKDLGLLGDAETRFIRWFSELRNRLAHRLDHVDFTFDVHISKLDKNQKKSWLARLTYFSDGMDSESQWRKIGQEKPKLALLMGVFHVVNMCSSHVIQAKGVRDVEEAANETTQSLLEPLDPTD